MPCGGLGSKISGLVEFRFQFYTHISELMRCKDEVKGVVGSGGSGGGDGPAPVSAELACRTCAEWGRYDVLDGGEHCISPRRRPA